MTRPRCVPGDALHHPDGTHRTTPASTSGRTLERHERKLRAHLAELPPPDRNPPLCVACFELRHGFDPDMGDPVTWEPGDCHGCNRAAVVFRMDDDTAGGVQ